MTVRQHVRGAMFWLETVAVEARSAREFTKIPLGFHQDAHDAARVELHPRQGRRQGLWPWVFNMANMVLVGGVGISAVYL